MYIFWALIGVTFAGVLFVFWLLRNEGKPALHDLGKPVAPTTAVNKPVFGAGFFKGNKTGKQSESKEGASKVPLSSIEDLVLRAAKEEVVAAQVPRQLSAEEEKKIDREIELTSQLDEWKIKYERLDTIFKEKSAALEKSQESFQNELNNRREFNKLKDILEKELKDNKDKLRLDQIELTAAKAEAESCKKEIKALEEKTAKLEKILNAKENEIAELNKCLQLAITPAAPVLPAPQALPKISDTAVSSDPVVSVEQEILQSLVTEPTTISLEPLPAQETSIQNKEKESQVIDPTINAPQPPEKINIPENNKDTQKE